MFSLNCFACTNMSIYVCIHRNIYIVTINVDATIKSGAHTNMNNSTPTDQTVKQQQDKHK